MVYKECIIQGIFYLFLLLMNKEKGNKVVFYIDKTFIFIYLIHVFFASFSVRFWGEKME